MAMNATKLKSWMVGLAALCLLVQGVSGARIRDVARLSTDVPNELEGMGLVFGLKGTGDGGDYAPAMRPLMELMKRFDDPVLLANEVKNANNVALVSVTMRIPSSGARAGEKLDVQVATLGAAKSIRGGRLFIIPMIAPQTNVKLVYGWASGDITLDDESTPTKGTIHEGGVLTTSILPNAIKGDFTLVLHPNTATMEMSTAVADRINEEVSTQTDGQPIATAVDATSVHVAIPKVEQANTTGFIARIRALPLPNISEPAKVFINTKTKTIVFTDEVELAPTLVVTPTGNMTVQVGTPAGNGEAARPATLSDLERAFNLLKVSPEERITIVQMLHKSNALKADLRIE